MSIAFSYLLFILVLFFHSGSGLSHKLTFLLKARFCLKPNQNGQYILQVERILLENIRSIPPFFNRTSSYIFVNFGTTKNFFKCSQVSGVCFATLCKQKLVVLLGIDCFDYFLLNFSTLSCCLLKISECHRECSDVCRSCVCVCVLFMLGPYF